MQGMCYNCFAEKSEDRACPHCGYSNISNIINYPLALREGIVLSEQYIVGRVLGQGGFGITYLAFDPKLRVKVAIKEFLPEGMAVRTNGIANLTIYSGAKQEGFTYGVERFLEEARVLAKFMSNRNIAAVKSYFNENNTAYFVMEYIEGTSFKNYIKSRGGKLEYTETLRILMPIMDALAAVHREGIIHRDVTPDNIYITKDDEVKLLDFGSARYSMGDKSKSLDVVLKAGYAPKEQYVRRSRQGAYTDVYSLAACFYVAITGYLPPEALERMEEDDIVEISTRGIKIPELLESAIMKGLEVNAGDRFQSMEEFKEAVRHISTSETDHFKLSLSATSASEKESPKIRKKKKKSFFKSNKRLMIILCIALGVVITVASVLMYFRNADSEDNNKSVDVLQHITESTEPSSEPDVEPETTINNSEFIEEPVQPTISAPTVIQKSTQVPSQQSP